MKYSIVIVFALLSSVCYAQPPHVHGGTIPDWYDPSCCSQRDCKPVEDKDIEFTTDALGGAVARYKPTGHRFYQRQFKTSQDERYHVCIDPNNTDDGMDGDGSTGSLCFYDRSGA